MLNSPKNMLLPSLSNKNTFDFRALEDSHLKQRSGKHEASQIWKTNSENNFLTDSNKEKTLLRIDSKLEIKKREIEQRNEFFRNIEKRQLKEQTSESLHKTYFDYQELSNKLASMTIKMEEYQEILQFYQQENEKLKKSLEVSHIDIKPAMQELQQTLQEISAKNSRFKQQIESQQKEIIQLKESNKVQAIQATQNEKLITSLQHQLVDLEKNKQNELLTITNDYLSKQKQLKEQIIDLKKNITNKKERSLVNIQLQQQIKQMEEGQKQLTKQNDINEEIIASKDQEIRTLSCIQEQQSIQLKNLEIQLEIQKKELEEKVKMLTSQNRQLEYEAQERRFELDSIKKQLEFKKSDDSPERLQKLLKLMNNQIKSLENAEVFQQMLKNLECHFCRKCLQNPVTIIPCGHSYCYDCKKGYQKQCFICQENVIIEATYRNELLDDFISMIKLVQQMIEVMKKARL